MKIVINNLGGNSETVVVFIRRLHKLIQSSESGKR